MRELRYRFSVTLRCLLGCLAAESAPVFACLDADATRWGLIHTPDIVSVELPWPPASTHHAAATGNAAASPAADFPGSTPPGVLIVATDGFFDTAVSNCDAVQLALRWVMHLLACWRCQQLRVRMLFWCRPPPMCLCLFKPTKRGPHPC